jgi:integrase
LRTIDIHSNATLAVIVRKMSCQRCCPASAVRPPGSAFVSTGNAPQPWVKGRTVALPLIVIAELKAWRMKQAEALLRLGVRLSEDTFICARENGAPLQPNSIGHAWDRFITATRLPRIRFHDLRHGHATALLAAGVHPKIASERLGHSRVALTLDTYSHVIPGMQEDAVARIDAAFSAAVIKRG